LNTSSTLIAEAMRQSKAVTLVKIAEVLAEHQNGIAEFMTEDDKGKRIPLLLESLARHFATERERLLQEAESLIKSVAHIREIVSMQQSYATAAGLTEPLDVNELMDDAVRINQESLTRRSIDLVRDYQPVPVVMADKGKVLQILVNLIRNSVQACEEAQAATPQITLRIAATNNCVRLSVIDNGIGIPQENLLRVFQHGFTTKKEGHGFGVHASANAARAMHGALTCDSDGPMKGACFVLELPA
jgi:signal transduction histidine kinase